jgi:hypothetical protein
VDGLRGPEENVNAYEARPYRIHHLEQTAFKGEAEDPDHSESPGRSISATCWPRRPRPHAAPRPTTAPSPPKSCNGARSGRKRDSKTQSKQAGHPAA